MYNEVEQMELNLYGMIYLYFIIALFGFVVGSFLNVCIFRIPEGKSIVFPPSSCGACGHKLSALDLVPVFSYLFLGCKCRYCNVKISPQYAIVEILTGLMFLSNFVKFGFTPEFFGFTFLMAILIAMFFIDLEHYIIPDGLVISGIIGGLIFYGYHLYSPIEYFGDKGWWNPLVGMFSSSLILFAIALIGMWLYKTEDAMGMGDVKIFLPIGLFLGWKMALLALALTVLSSSVISLLLVLFRVMKLKGSAIPLGPFIVIGTYATIHYGKELVGWYFGG